MMWFKKGDDAAYYMLNVKDPFRKWSREKLMMPEREVITLGAKFLNR